MNQPAISEEAEMMMWGKYASSESENSTSGGLIGSAGKLEKLAEVEDQQRYASGSYIGSISKPCQEKLLNMAEARREIAAALKLHRAARKRTKEGPEAKPFAPESRQSFSEQEAKLCCSSYGDNSMAYSPRFFAPYSLPVSSPTGLHENLDFALPMKSLGLNLNLQGFSNVDTSTNHYNPSSSIYSSSSPSTSSSPAPETPYTGVQTPVVADVVESGNSSLMAEEIRCHHPPQIESNDGLKLNLDIRPVINEKDDDNFVNCSTIFDDQVMMEIPDWLNANESCLQHVTDFCSDDHHQYLQDPVLPCMEIEEIEGMDEYLVVLMEELVNDSVLPKATLYHCIQNSKINKQNQTSVKY